MCLSGLDCTLGDHLVCKSHMMCETPLFMWVCMIWCLFFFQKWTKFLFSRSPECRYLHQIFVEKTKILIGVLRNKGEPFGASSQFNKYFNCDNPLCWFICVCTLILSFLVFHQAWISSEEASLLCSLHSRLFTFKQDGPCQSFGEGMEAILLLLYITAWYAGFQSLGNSFNKEVHSQDYNYKVIT